MDVSTADSNLTHCTTGPAPHCGLCLKQNTEVFWGNWISEGGGEGVSGVVVPMEGNEHKKNKGKVGMQGDNCVRRSMQSPKLFCLLKVWVVWKKVKLRWQSPAGCSGQNRAAQGKTSSAIHTANVYSLKRGREALRSYQLDIRIWSHEIVLKK